MRHKPYHPRRTVRRSCGRSRRSSGCRSSNRRSEGRRTPICGGRTLGRGQRLGSPETPIRSRPGSSHSERCHTTSIAYRSGHLSVGRPAFIRRFVRPCPAGVGKAGGRDDVQWSGGFRPPTMLGCIRCDLGSPVGASDGTIHRVGRLMGPVTQTNGALTEGGKR